MLVGAKVWSEKVWKLLVVTHLGKNSTPRMRAPMTERIAKSPPDPEDQPRKPL